MPIASDRAPGIQVGNIASVGADNPPPPAVGQMMDAFREGFITVDDIQRRFRQGQSEASALKTQLQADEIQRRLAPGAEANAMAAQGLQASQIESASQVLPGQTQNTLTEQKLKGRELGTQEALTSPDSATRQGAIDQQTEMEYQTVFGEPPPDSFDTVAPEPPQSFQAWFDENKGPELEEDVLAFSQIPGPKPSAREIQAYANKLSQQGVTGKDFEERVLSFSSGTQKDPQVIKAFADRRLAEMQASQLIREEWKAGETKKQGAIKKVAKGDPSYNLQLRQMVEVGKQNKLLQGAKVAALGEGFKAQAKAAAELPAAQAKAAKEGIDAALMERAKSEAIKRFIPQAEAFVKMDEIRNSGRTMTNADDISIMYEYVKLLDPTSAVREGEAKLAASTVPAVRAIYNKGKALFVDQNKLFDDQTRQSLFVAMDDLRAGAEKSIRPELARVAQVAISRGAPMNQVFTEPELKLLNGTSSTPAAGAQGGAAAPPKNVGSRRVVQDGVTFEWNGTAYVPVQ